jgi:hypothetical protein
MAAATTIVARIHMPVKRSEKAATTSGGGGAGAGLWSHGITRPIAGGANEGRNSSHLKVQVLGSDPK